MVSREHNHISSSVDALPSPGRLLVFAIIVPAIVAATNQALLHSIPYVIDLHPLLFPWMAVSIAVLSWTSGRYLFPTWLSWLVFAWGLALLDCLTIAACLGGPVPPQLGYVLVSAQISLLVLWGVLGPGVWQWRLPIVAAIAPVVIVFSGSFYRNTYHETIWNVMMLCTTAIVALLCGGLRYLGFTLHRLSADTESSTGAVKKPTYQFSLKHMLIWLTVSGPLLLFVRALDLDGKTVFPALFVAMSVATVNLFALWAVLGAGVWFIRLSALAAPFAIGVGLQRYSAALKAATGGSMNYVFMRTISYALIEMRDIWITWLCLDVTLLAALLLFLRASGYRLVRTHAAAAIPMRGSAPAASPAVNQQQSTIN